MKKITESRRKAKKFFKMMAEEKGVMLESFETIREEGKRALDSCMLQMGRMLAEAVMSWEREEIGGQEYAPDKAYQKWGWQEGSIYLGHEKMKISHPRLRNGAGEVILPSYQRMRSSETFSEEMLVRALRGVSGRKYRETLVGVGKKFGVSPTSISNRLIEATSKKLKCLRERDLSSFDLFALFLDTVHRGGVAFVVALGLDTKGKKQILGFWEGASENKEVTKSLFSDLESRGLRLSEEILFITDGGKGIISALKSRYGKDLMHQRCTIHKDRNIQRHLPKRYRQEAHRRFRNALAMIKYEEANKALKEFEDWLSGINDSAVASLKEAREELLTLHRLEVPALLRKTLHSTNPIESIFSTVRHCEKNIKRYSSSKMSQRWLAAISLYAEENFRTVKGHRGISEVTQKIKLLQNKKIKTEAA